MNSELDYIGWIDDQAESAADAIKAAISSKKMTVSSGGALLASFRSETEALERAYLKQCGLECQESKAWEDYLLCEGKEEQKAAAKKADDLRMRLSTVRCDCNDIYNRWNQTRMRIMPFVREGVKS